MFLKCFLVCVGTLFFFLMFILLSRICITTTVATVATYLFSILFMFTSPAADVEERRKSATVREHAIIFSSVNANNNTLC